jgi:hypothetical protein
LSMACSTNGKNRNASRKAKRKETNGKTKT